MRTNSNSKSVDFSEKLRPYENKWVALSKDKNKILASGNTLKETKEKADKISKKYLFLKVLPFGLSYIPSAQPFLLF